jgi:glycerol-3-phosphate responsive antiterminator
MLLFSSKNSKTNILFLKKCTQNNSICSGRPQYVIKAKEKEKANNILRIFGKTLISSYLFHFRGTEA